MRVAELLNIAVLIIMFYQWVHPITLLKLEGKATRKSLLITNTIGLGGPLAFIIIFIILLNFEYKLIWLILLGFILITICIHNIIISIKTFSLIESTSIREKYYLLATTITSVLFIALIFIITYGSPLDSPSIISLSIFQFNEKSILFVTMILQISLFILITVSAYTFVIYYTVNTLRGNKKYTIDQNKNFIKNRFRATTILLVILFGVFLSFFHFAEINTLQLPGSYRNYFESTFQIFQLIASAVFIPILLKSILEPKRSDKIIFDILKELKQVNNEVEDNESILLILTSMEITLNKIAYYTEKKLTTSNKIKVNKKGKNGK